MERPTESTRLPITDRENSRGIVRGRAGFYRHVDEARPTTFCGWPGTTRRGKLRRATASEGIVGETRCTKVSQHVPWPRRPRFTTRGEEHSEERPGSNKVCPRLTAAGIETLNGINH